MRTFTQASEALDDPRVFLRWGIHLWIAALLSASLSWSQSVQGVAELEVHKKRLADLQQTMDPVTAARLKQMYRLLSLMQESIKAEKAKKAQAEPMASPTPPIEKQTPVVVTPKNELQVKVPSAVKDVIPPAPKPAIVAKSPPIPTSVLIRLISKQASVAPPISPPFLPRPPEPKQPPLPDWLVSSSLTLSPGYQENVLRSAFSDLESVTMNGAIELQVLNTHREQTRVSGYARYTRTHFLEQSEVPDEDMLLVLGRVDRRLNETRWWGLQGTYLMAHQPFDDPDLIDLESGSAPLKFTQLSIAPQVTWEPDDQRVWTAQLGYRRESTEGLEDFEPQDSDQWFGRLDYRFTRGAHQWRVSYSYEDRQYDERFARFPDGKSTGDPVSIQSHGLSLTYRYTWQWAQSHCRLTTTLGYEAEHGDSGGYDDLERLDLRTKIQWRLWPVALTAELRYGPFFYGERQVSQNDQDLRQREFWATRVEASYALSRKLAWVLNYEYRDHSGNRRSDDYAYRILSTGFQFRF